MREDYAVQHKCTPSKKRREARGDQRPKTRPNLALVQPIARRALETGTVVWAHVPYETLDGEKTRPAVVIEVRGREVVVAPGTTSRRAAEFPHRYLPIADLEAAGLTRRTWLVNRVVVIDLIELVSISGRLGELDLARAFRHLSVLSPRAAA